MAAGDRGRARSRGAGERDRAGRRRAPATGHPGARPDAQPDTGPQV